MQDTHSRISGLIEYKFYGKSNKNREGEPKSFYLFDKLDQVGKHHAQAFFHPLMNIQDS